LGSWKFTLSYENIDCLFENFDLQYMHMAHIITFQIDYSDQAETLSASSINTAITLTNLMSGVDYSINVTAITDVGEITTNSISIVTSKDTVTLV